MAVKVIEPSDAIEVKNIVCLIYGQPGARKTSLAQTADEPVTLAFDPGVYRAFGRKRAALFDTWQDVLGYDLSTSNTPVIDTIGMCLDKLAVAVIEDNPKNGNRMGGLSLQGYGVLKEQFKQWLARRREQGQDLVFIAHETQEKIGNETYHCPDIVGGSYNTIMNHADIVGYMHFENGKRVIDFAPTDRWMAKIPPGWGEYTRRFMVSQNGQIALPDFGKEPNFLAHLIAEAKASMGRASGESAAIARQVAEWTVRLTPQLTPDALNEMLPEMGRMEKAAKVQCWHAAQKHAESFGLAFNADTRRFVPVTQQEGSPDAA